MPFFLVRHRVADYKRWKPFFDAHSSARKAHGMRGGYLFRNADDPNELVVLFEADDLDGPRRLSQSGDTKQILEQSGVIGTPDAIFLEEIERFQD